MLRQKRKPKPKTEAELVVQTLHEIHDRERRRKKPVPRFYRRVLPAWVDRRVLFSVLFLVAIFIGDGVRRENKEFVATLVQATGTVQVRTSSATVAAAGTQGMQLEDGGVVMTGDNSYATLDFPDGSAISVAPDSTFEVRLLEYSRGGRWRSRSFRLLAGQAWAKVSHYFGQGSDLRIYTPAAVAAVRGTEFRISYDPVSHSTNLACADGTVSYMGWSGNPVAVSAGQDSSTTYGQQPSNPAAATPSQVAPFGEAAMIPDRDAPLIKKIELTVTAWLDLPLSVLGIGRCSWGVGAAEKARRAAAMESLRLIEQNLEGSSQYPSHVDPCTLRELGLPQAAAARLLSEFSDDAIERYWSNGQTFVLYARARDKGRTLYKLTPYGVEKATPQEAQALSLWGG